MVKSKLLYVVAALLLMLSACSNENTEINNYRNNKMSRVLMDIPSSENIGSVKCLFFKEEGLAYAGSILPSGSELKLPLEGAGSLYLIANEGGKVDAAVGSGVSEMSWQEATIGLDETGNPLPFMLGKTSVKDDVAEYSVVMKRGVARFDVVYAFQGTQVKSLSLKGMSDKSYLIERVPLSVPSDAGKVDLKVSGESLTGADQTGVLYAYEQVNPEATVEVEMPDGKVHSAKLPGQIMRNKVYTLQIGRDGSLHSITVGDWVKEEDEILTPDRETVITVNRELSSLNDKFTVFPDNRGISLSYLPVEADIALNCGEELEYVGGGDSLVEVSQPYPNAATLAERNIFRITKKLVAPNSPSEDVKLQFKRKQLTEVYEEDCLQVVLEKNDDVVEGLLDFDNENYTCDFARYIDGNLGTYTVGEGKTLSVEVAESNPWVGVVRSSENANSYVVQAGWRPNDPEADGRVQTAKLIVSDSQGNRQEYTISRRNYGLPVVKVAGNWWCKYNLRGTANDFEDQILCSKDPVKNGNLLEYLKSCSQEELMAVMGDQYQGGNLEGLPLALSGGKFQYTGFKSSVSVNINTQAKQMAPVGYEMPSETDFRRLVASNDYKLLYEGMVYNNMMSGDNFFRIEYLHGNRAVTVDEVSYGKIGFYDFCESDYKADNNRHVVLFGWGHQWEATAGSVSTDDFLFATNSGNSTSWMMEAWFVDMRGNWFKSSTQNNVKTRTIRCKKSPVEYIY